MNAIRIKRHLDSETLRLPELKPLIGRDVEIIVLEEIRRLAKPAKKKPVKKRFEEDLRKMRNQQTLDELAAAQGVEPVTDFKQLRGIWPKEELEDGFEDDLNRRRKSEIVPELKKKHVALHIGHGHRLV